MARANAASARARAAFPLGDLRSLDLPGPPFDAAVCLFASIGYVASNQALAQALQGLGRAVRPLGLLVLEFWHAAAMLRSHEPVRVRRWATPSGEVLRISETTLDCERQLAAVTYSVYEHRDDGTYSSFRETQTNRYFLVQEMASWLSMAGFQPLAWCDGFSLDRRVSDSTWHVVAVARRAPGGGPGCGERSCAAELRPISEGDSRLRSRCWSTWCSWPGRPDIASWSWTPRPSWRGRPPRRIWCSRRNRPSRCAGSWT